MELLVPVSINIVLVIGTYLLNKHTKFKDLPYLTKQLIIGVIFGALSCFASSYGVEILETKANVRDAAPLSAGLIFGGPAGIIAGIMGGLYRFISVYWGAGYYTRIACTIATMLAGVMAAALRKFMFDNKKPTWSYAIAITILCEVVHMLLILATNMSDSVYAFEFVKGATLPMIIGNVVAVGGALVGISLISKEGIKRKRSKEHIAETFQRWLLFSIVCAYFVTSMFTFNLQNVMSTIDTESIFETAIKDVVADIKTKSDSKLLEKAIDIKGRYESDREQSLMLLAQESGVVEINVVNSEGIIINSSINENIGFDMNSTSQSSEFMPLLQGENSIVQEYRAMGSDGKTMRKYGGVSTDYGFIQVGYSADQFHWTINEFVIDVTRNRHVGSNGFITICDEDLYIVSYTAEKSGHIESIGIIPNDEMLQGKSASQIYKTEIKNRDTQEFEEYRYAFTFVEGYCVIAAMPDSEAMFMRDASFYTSVFTQVLIFATLFVFIYILIKRVIINNLKKINNTLAQITEGNLNVTVNVRTNEEFASLSDDINSTVSTLKNYISEAAARIDKELEYAKQIQLSALPTNYPDNEKYSIYAQMIAAKEVGGDFYDFYKLSDSSIAFLAADVSGKGIPAAMFMMTAKTIIKDLAESGMAVNDIFTRANEKLCENNESGMFVTAWMGILDINTGKLTYANAGHNPPLIKRKDGSFEYMRSRAGFVLAGMEGIKYRANEIDLHPGDRLFLYTDGVTEATNTENELYGEDRLLDYFNQNSDVNSTQLLPALKNDIDRFVGEAPQFDDITMLMFDFKIQERGADMSNMTQKNFPAKIDALNDVLGFVEENLEQYGCPMKVMTSLCVAVEEVFVNVAHYAYGGGEGDVSFGVSFDEQSREITFRMADRGVQFDPLKKPDPDITLSAEERQIGGLGIFITKKIMDSVAYSYENNENILTMIKKI